MKISYMGSRCGHLLTVICMVLVLRYLNTIPSVYAMDRDDSNKPDNNVRLTGEHQVNLRSNQIVQNQPASNEVGTGTSETESEKNEVEDKETNFEDSGSDKTVELAGGLDSISVDEEEPKDDEDDRNDGDERKTDIVGFEHFSGNQNGPGPSAPIMEGSEEIELSEGPLQGQERDEKSEEAEREDTKTLDEGTEETKTEEESKPDEEVKEEQNEEVSEITKKYVEKERVKGTEDTEEDSKNEEVSKEVLDEQVIEKMERGELRSEDKEQELREQIKERDKEKEKENKTETQNKELAIKIEKGESSKVGKEVKIRENQEEDKGEHEREEEHGEEGKEEERGETSKGAVEDLSKSSLKRLKEAVKRVVTLESCRMPSFYVPGDVDVTDRSESRVSVVRPVSSYVQEEMSLKDMDRMAEEQRSFSMRLFEEEGFDVPEGLIRRPIEIEEIRGEDYDDDEGIEEMKEGLEYGEEAKEMGGVRRRRELGRKLGRNSKNIEERKNKENRYRTIERRIGSGRINIRNEEEDEKDVEERLKEHNKDTEYRKEEGITNEDYKYEEETQENEDEQNEIEEKIREEQKLKEMKVMEEEGAVGGVEVIDDDDDEGQYECSRCREEMEELIRKGEEEIARISNENKEIKEYNNEKEEEEEESMTEQEDDEIRNIEEVEEHNKENREDTEDKEKLKDRKEEEENREDQEMEKDEKESESEDKPEEDTEGQQNKDNDEKEQVKEEQIREDEQNEIEEEPKEDDGIRDEANDGIDVEKQEVHRYDRNNIVDAPDLLMDILLGSEVRDMESPGVLVNVWPMEASSVEKVARVLSMELVDCSNLLGHYYSIEVKGKRDGIIRLIINKEAGDEMLRVKDKRFKIIKEKIEKEEQSKEKRDDEEIEQNKEEKYKENPEDKEKLKDRKEEETKEMKQVKGEKRERKRNLLEILLLHLSMLGREGIEYGEEARERVRRRELRTRDRDNEVNELPKKEQNEIQEVEEIEVNKELELEKRQEKGEERTRKIDIPVRRDDRHIKLEEQEGAYGIETETRRSRRRWKRDLEAEEEFRRWVEECSRNAEGETLEDEERDIELDGELRLEEEDAVGGVEIGEVEDEYNKKQNKEIEEYNKDKEDKENEDRKDEEKKPLVVGYLMKRDKKVRELGSPGIPLELELGIEIGIRRFERELREEEEIKMRGLGQEEYRIDIRNEEEYEIKERIQNEELREDEEKEGSSSMSSRGVGILMGEFSEEEWVGEGEGTGIQNIDREVEEKLNHREWEDGDIEEDEGIEETREAGEEDSAILYLGF